MLLVHYFVNIIKNVTRVSRGDGGRYHFAPNTPILRNWKKAEQVTCPLDDNIVGRRLTVKTVDIAPCSHEEVDKRMILHAIQELSSILLKATYTDIAVICAFLLCHATCKRSYIKHLIENY